MAQIVEHIICRVRVMQSAAFQVFDLLFHLRISTWHNHGASALNSRRTPLIIPPSNSLCGSDDRGAVPDDHALIRGYLAHNPGLTAGALSAARHFLKWAKAHEIAYRDLDPTAVDRFARHRCRCGRYSPGQLRNPVYLTDVRRFLRYLENAEIVTIPDGIGRLDRHLEAFSRRLEAVGYSKPAFAGRLSQARHFAEWIFQSRITAPEIDESHYRTVCPASLPMRYPDQAGQTGGRPRNRRSPSRRPPFHRFPEGTGCDPADHAQRGREGRPATGRL